MDRTWPPSLETVPPQRQPAERGAPPKSNGAQCPASAGRTPRNDLERFNTTLKTPAPPFRRMA
jgi:hypothetical protein